MGLKKIFAKLMGHEDLPKSKSIEEALGKAEAGELESLQDRSMSKEEVGEALKPIEEASERAKKELTEDRDLSAE